MTTHLGHGNAWELKRVARSCTKRQCKASVYLCL